MQFVADAVGSEGDAAVGVGGQHARVREEILEGAAGGAVELDGDLVFIADDGAGVAELEDDGFGAGGLDEAAGDVGLELGVVFGHADGDAFKAGGAVVGGDDDLGLELCGGDGVQEGLLLGEGEVGGDQEGEVAVDDAEGEGRHGVVGGGAENFNRESLARDGGFKEAVAGGKDAGFDGGAGEAVFETGGGAFGEEAGDFPLGEDGGDGGGMNEQTDIEIIEEGGETGGMFRVGER
jgi:hypothetical protein